MFPMLDQLSFGFPQLAEDRLEQLLSEELAREAADLSFSLILIQRATKDLDDAA